MKKRAMALVLTFAFMLSAGTALAVGRDNIIDNPVKKKIIVNELQRKAMKERYQVKIQQQLLSDAQKKILLHRALSDRLFVRGVVLKYDVPPYIKDNRTLIPVRAITEALGAEVKWDQETNTVTITRDETTIEVTLGQNTVMVNGEQVTIEVPAEMNADRIFVPLRFVSQTLGETVEYDAETGDIDVALDEEVITETVDSSTDADTMTVNTATDTSDDATQ